MRHRGNEAIALIEKEKFSLILLDLMMPDLNGDEVLKVIKSDPDQRDIPVVMISADTNADKVSQCIELGADDYLPKPFNPTILRARIGATLRRHSLRALKNEYLGKIENEKRHSENLLRNILPTEIVHQRQRQRAPQPPRPGWALANSPSRCARPHPSSA